MIGFLRFYLDKLFYNPIFSKIGSHDIKWDDLSIEDKTNLKNGQEKTNTEVIPASIEAYIPMVI